jgi:hypothetical protein
LRLTRSGGQVVDLPTLRLPHYFFKKESGEDLEKDLAQGLFSRKTAGKPLAFYIYRFAGLFPPSSKAFIFFKSRQGRDIDRRKAAQAADI